MRKLLAVWLVFSCLLLVGCAHQEVIQDKIDRTKNSDFCKNFKKSIVNPLPNSCLHVDVINNNDAPLGEGDHNIVVNAESTFLLPSGAKVILWYFIFDGEIWLSQYSSATKKYYNEKASSGNSLKLVNNLKTYHKGYVYTFSDINCLNGDVSYGDYRRYELTECSWKLNITKWEPNIVRYDTFIKKFSSTEAWRIPIVTNSSEPFVMIVPPYIALIENSKYQSKWESIEIYTHLGMTEFTFENLVDDLHSKATKVKKIGPLTLSLQIEKIWCYPPFLQKTWECAIPVGSKLDYINYGKIDFILTITQDSSLPSQDIKILDYRW